MVEHIAETIIAAIKKKRKILICGCGGSAAQAQHFSSELLGKYKHDRRALPALSLTTDTSTLTSIGNDYGFSHVFSRQVEGLGQKGDVLITLSTSGTSPSIVEAQNEARDLGLTVIPFPTNKDLGTETPETQEHHLSMIHDICYIVEREFL